jgi:SAM-dependent methyltransferase
LKFQDLQHTIFQVLRGKNYCGPVEEVLTLNSGYEKAILDLGCGTGLWAREMAAEFPHCEIVGVDLVPIQAQPLPPNCRIELDDITLGLEHFYGAFDMVHARLLSSGIQDFPRLIDDISRVLRPGGLLLLADIPFQIFDSSRNLISPFEPDVSRRCWLGLFAHSFCTAIAAKGGDATSAHKFEMWVREVNVFEDLRREDIWMPIGKWYMNPANEEQTRMNLAGELVRRDVVALVKASKALLMSSGLLESFVDSMQQSALQELADLAFGRGQKLCGVFQSVWARKGV